MFISNAMAAGPDAATSGYSSIIMMVLFAVVFYFVLIRPQSKRQKEQKSMLDSIQKGDEVVLIGKQGDLEISVSSFSEFSDQVNYELLTRLPQKIPRFIVD